MSVLSEVEGRKPNFRIAQDDRYYDLRKSDESIMYKAIDMLYADKFGDEYISIGSAISMFIGTAIKMNDNYGLSSRISVVELSDHPSVAYGEANRVVDDEIYIDAEELPQLRYIAVVYGVYDPTALIADDIVTDPKSIVAYTYYQVPNERSYTSLIKIVRDRMSACYFGLHVDKDDTGSLKKEIDVYTDNNNVMKLTMTYVGESDKTYGEVGKKGKESMLRVGIADVRVNTISGGGVSSMKKWMNKIGISDPHHPKEAYRSKGYWIKVNN